MVQFGAKIFFDFEYSVIVLSRFISPNKVSQKQDFDVYKKNVQKKINRSFTEPLKYNTLRLIWIPVTNS